MINLKHHHQQKHRYHQHHHHSELRLAQVLDYESICDVAVLLNSASGCKQSMMLLFVSQSEPSSSQSEPPSQSLDPSSSSSSLSSQCLPSSSSSVASSSFSGFSLPLKSYFSQYNQIKISRSYDHVFSRQQYDENMCGVLFQL